MIFLWLFVCLFRNTGKCNSFSFFFRNTCLHLYMYFGQIIREERPNLIRQVKWFYTPVGARRVLSYGREKSVFFSMMMSNAPARRPLSFYIEKIVSKSRRGFRRNRIRWNVEGTCKQETPCRKRKRVIFIIIIFLLINFIEFSNKLK